MSEKRYYWIKLKTDFFDLPEIDWLLSQKNGAEYIVLYQMLCLMTANNNGELSSKFGEMIVPYDVEKIVRDTKYFDFDTVKVALELYKKLGLIYESEDNALRISNYEEMIGISKTDDHTKKLNAERQRRFREKKRIENNVTVTEELTLNRNTEIDIEKEIDIDNKKEINKEKIPYKEIIDCLNNLAKTNYRPTSKETKDKIKARWNEGFRLNDFETVIKNKCNDWLGTDMEKFLRPITLFGTKFESYLNQKSHKSIEDVPDWYHDTKQTEMDQELLDKIKRKQQELRIGSEKNVDQKPK